MRLHYRLPAGNLSLGIWDRTSWLVQLLLRKACYLHCLDVSSCFRQRIGSSIECASSGVFGVTHYCGALQRYH